MNAPSQVFRQVTKRMCGNLDLEAALDDCRGYLSTLMPVDAIHVIQVDRIAGLARTVAFSSAFKDSFLSRDEVLSIPRAAISKLYAYQRRIGPIINRPVEVPEIFEVFERYGIRTNVSMLHLDLPGDERTANAVNFSAEGEDRYESRHFELIQHLIVPFSIAVSNALRYEEVNRLRACLEEDNQHLRRELRRSTATVIGGKLGLRHVMEMVEQVAPTDSPVLLLGETGSGKEVIANVLHEQSNRRAGALVRINCGAIPESLVDSELFGHERGAFTGAVATKIGVFERADGGTIFLDEVGELPPTAQVKLLRVLQSMQLERVGGIRTVTVDVRVVAATHRDLAEMVRVGTFRQDLWYRLNVFPIHVPPLRERKVDIPTLTRYFIDQRARELNLSNHPTLAEGSIEQLMAYDWPGNVRELGNVIERALILAGGRPLTFPGLGQEPVPSPLQESDDSPVLAFDESTARHIRRALELTGGRIKGPGGAAELLRVHPSTLRNKMNRLGIAVLADEE